MTVNPVSERNTQQIHFFLKDFTDCLLTSMILTGLKRALDTVNHDYC